MDPSGAAALGLRLEERKQWSSATAVKDGRQPELDPDVEFLRELGYNERIYEGADGVFVKRLLGGVWTDTGATPVLRPTNAPGGQSLHDRLDQQANS